MPAYNILNEVLFDAVARGSGGGPTFKRIKVYTEGNALKQRFLWSRQKLKFDLNYGIKTQPQFEKIRSVFYVVFGNQYDGFLVRDWGDYKLTQALSSVTLISGTTWRVNRRYTTPGGTSYHRPLTRLNAGLRMYSAGGALLGSTFDDETGIVTVPTGTPAYAVGSFNVPVTFVDDSLENIELDGNVNFELQALPSVPIEELWELDE
jgi:uncharacterized protein (TIGR02217 family)